MDIGEARVVSRDGVKVIEGGLEALHRLRGASDFCVERWPEDKPHESWEGVKIANGKVVELRFAGTYANRCRLPFLPPEIGGLVAITTLELSWMRRLSDLPAEISQLVNLTSLDLSGCQQIAALPGGIGELRELTSLNLYQCRMLITLPPEIGNLTKLRELNVSDCYELLALPLEIGMLQSLTTLKLTGCEQLAFPPEAMHKSPVDEIVGFLAAHLVTNTTKPAEAVAALVAQPLAVAVFLKKIISDPQYAEGLGKACGADSALCDLTDAKGIRAIELACAQCKKAMTAGLLFLSRFRVDAGPLHFSTTSAVLGSSDHINPDVGSYPRRALKCMRSEGHVLAELKARQGLDNNFVANILAVYVDSSEPPLTEQYDGKIPVEVREDLAGKLANLLKARRGHGTSHGPGEDAACTGFKYMIVLRMGDRNLESVLRSDRVAARDFPLMRRIATDLGRGLQHLHEKGRIHADFKPLNAVRLSGTTSWQLIDLGVSCRVGKRFGVEGGKGPSQAYCPPEMAKVMLQEITKAAIDAAAAEAAEAAAGPNATPQRRIANQSGTTTGGRKVESSPMKQFDKVSVAYDLWSFGATLFYMTFGRPLWLTAADDALASEADLRTLAEWDHEKLDALLLRGSTRPTREQLTAAELIRRLLDPSPLQRVAHFTPPGGGKPGIEMKTVLEHAFMQGASLDAATLKANQLKLDSGLKGAAAASQLADDARAEQRTMREALLKDRVERGDEKAPTAIVMLGGSLFSDEQVSRLSQLVVKSDGSTLVEPRRPASRDPVLAELEAQQEEEDEAEQQEEAANGDGAAETTEQLVANLKARVDFAANFLKALTTLGAAGAADADASSSSSSYVGDVTQHSATELAAAYGLVQDHGEVYLYLIDELTGEPVAGEGYPIALRTPSETCLKLLPLVQICARGMAIYEGALGVARMFGCPIAALPPAWEATMLQSIAMLKQSSSVMAFRGLHAPAGLEMQSLFGRQDAARGYGGLRRVGDDDSTVVWTAILSPKKVAAAVTARMESRITEQARSDKSLRRMMLQSTNDQALVKQLSETVAKREAELRKAEKAGKDAADKAERLEKDAKKKLETIKLLETREKMRVAQANGEEGVAEGQSLDEAAAAHLEAELKKALEHPAVAQAAEAEARCAELEAELKARDLMASSSGAAEARIAELEAQLNALQGGGSGSASGAASGGGGGGKKLPALLPKAADVEDVAAKPALAKAPSKKLSKVKASPRAAQPMSSPKGSARGAKKDSARGAKKDSARGSKEPETAAAPIVAAASSSSVKEPSPRLEAPAPERQSTTEKKKTGRKSNALAARMAMFGS